MKNQQFRKLFKLKTKNSGFTLLELLTGLIMSGIVIGVLGVGFYQVLKVTSEDTAKSKAGQQASRAIEFITDELRRSKGIEINTSIGYVKNRPNNPATPHVDEATIPIGPSYNLPTGGTVRLALEIPGVSERVIYAVAPPQDDSPWEGPLVIYRWGPPFDADGNYTNENNVADWDNLALVDKVDDTIQSITCEGNTISYQGFYACIEDDDGDGITEDGLTDTNGDGDVNAEDSIDDVDGIGTTAQLFFTGGISTTTGNDTNYSTNTQVVTRVKEADVVGKKENLTTQFGVEGLGSDFSCNPQSSTNWTMRTDFSQDFSKEDPDDPNSKWIYEHQEENNPTEDRWIYDPDLRGKAFEFEKEKPLSITAIPIGASNCTNTKFDGKDNGELAASDSWHDDPDGDGPEKAKDIVYTQHIIDFNNPYTFNGNGTLSDGTNYDSVDVRTDSNADGVIDSNDQTNPQVKVLKEGSEVPNVGGFDANGDGVFDPNNDQPSLGEFLYQKNLADRNNIGTEADPVYEYTINSNLKPDQRIIAFEIGQDYQPDNPNNNGFDLQDNIFVVTSKAFEKQFESSDLE